MKKKKTVCMFVHASMNDSIYHKIWLFLAKNKKNNASQCSLARSLCLIIPNKTHTNYA